MRDHSCRECGEHHDYENSDMLCHVLLTTPNTNIWQYVIYGYRLAEHMAELQERNSKVGFDLLRQGELSKNRFPKYGADRVKTI
jgi:hypothetical protein